MAARGLFGVPACSSPPSSRPQRPPPMRDCQSHSRSAAGRAQPRHAGVDRGRRAAAAGASPVEYSAASRSQPCVSFTVADLHPARLEPTRGCRSPLHHKRSRIPRACASSTHAPRRKKDLIAEPPAGAQTVHGSSSVSDGQRASTELPQAVVQRCNLRSCLGSTNKPRAWFASSRHRS